MTYSSEYRKMKKFIATVDAIRAFPGAEGVREAAFEHPRHLDRDAFFGLVASSSYVMHGVSDRADFDEELAALFDGHVGGSWGVNYRGFRVVELKEDGSLLSFIMNPVKRQNDFMQQHG